MATSIERLPGPRSPQLVQLAPLVRGEGRFITAQQRRFGDSFPVHFERRPWCVFADPEDIRTVVTLPSSVAHAAVAASRALRPGAVRRGPAASRSPRGARRRPSG